MSKFHRLDSSTIPVCFCTVDSVSPFPITISQTESPAISLSYPWEVRRGFTSNVLISPSPASSASSIEIDRYPVMGWENKNMKPNQVGLVLTSDKGCKTEWLSASGRTETSWKLRLQAMGKFCVPKCQSHRELGTVEHVSSSAKRKPRLKKQFILHSWFY